MTSWKIIKNKFDDSFCTGNRQRVVDRKKHIFLLLIISRWQDRKKSFSLLIASLKSCTTNERKSKGYFDCLWDH